MGEALYDRIGIDYAGGRTADPRIERRIHAALGDARSVLNVGAGTGSYEPRDRIVVAVEPSAVMRRQRASSRVPAVNAVAESLPFDDRSFDAAMAVLTIHHWSDLEAGLRELRRVARDRIVIVTIDAERSQGWLTEDYVPEIAEVDRSTFPQLRQLPELLGAPCVVEPLMVPSDCNDEFLGAFWSRPESYLDPEVRARQSVWWQVGPEVEQRAVDRLRQDLASGAWDARHGHLRTQAAFDGGYRLVVASLDASEHRPQQPEASSFESLRSEGA